MRFDNLSPAGIVQPAESKAMLIGQAKDMYRDLVAVERTGLKKAVDLGCVLLRLRPLCGQGEWRPTLDQMGITKSRAWEYMELAKVPARDKLLNCSSIREALALYALTGEQDKDEEAGDADDHGDQEPDGAEQEEFDSSDSQGGKATSKSRNQGKSKTSGRRTFGTASGDSNGEGDAPVLDALDVPVPAGLIPVFQKRQEFKEMINQLNAMKRKLEQLKDHPAGALIRLSQAEPDIRNLKETIEFDAPYCVCPVCGGDSKKRRSSCPCKDRGWLNQSAYGRLPQECRQ
jgi:hypothetical protein